jgi:hypothetical protein
MSNKKRGSTPVLLWIIRFLIVALFCVTVAIVANRLVEYHQRNKSEQSGQSESILLCLDEKS